MPVEISSMITDVLLNLALGVVALLGALATLYIQKGIRKLQAETEKVQDEAIRYFMFGALARLDDVAYKTVNKIEQTTKQQILLGIKNGINSNEDIKALAKQAYDEIVKTLEPEYMEAIKETMGDAETYIKNLIEEKLEEIKTKRPKFVFGDFSTRNTTVVEASKELPTAPEVSS